VDWLDVTPNNGILDPNNSIEVNVSILPTANLLDPNIYTSIVIFQNTISGSIKQRLVTLTVKPTDCFTESFDESENDLRFLSLTFSPDGSNACYEACWEKTREFYTDPNGSTLVSLGDDDFAEVILSGGKEVLFYGQRYDRFYIGSNGYITFGEGDAELSGTLENHFNLPRISGLFTDLSPASSQNISYKQLDDSIVVTFKDVPNYGDKTSENSFQIEMFFVDGAIRLTWLNTEAGSGVAGLSEGYGLPPAFFVESDLNKYSPCWPSGDFSRNYSVDFIDFAVLAMHWLDEGCGIPYWCGKSDLNFSSIVDTNDMGIFADNWLVTTDYWWLDPFSHWKFDEGSGTTAHDSTGFSDGTIYGAAWTTGQIGAALSFDGVDDYVEVSNIPFNFGVTTDFSICTWVKTTAPWGIIIDKWKESKYEEVSGFGLRIEGGRATILVRDPSYITVGCSTTTIIFDGQWHFITVVADRDDNLEIYNNGVREDFRPLTPVGNINNDIALAIGKGVVNSYPRFFSGLIDDVRIYKRALSAQEVFELCQAGHRGRAFNPYPSNGATSVDPNVVLTWLPGKNAISHDVYFGTDYNDVNDGVGDTYKGSYDVNSYDPNGLALGTTYYWRIDESNDITTIKGDVWSFTTVPPPPGQATNPNPADLATNVSVTADLYWTAGAGATSRDVYFGTSSPGTYRGSFTGTTFDPGTMSYNTTYYWRIDEKNAGGTTTGAVWRFTTVPLPPNTATNPNPANFATNVSVTADLSWSAGSGATSHDVYFGTSSPGTFQGNWTGTTFDPGVMSTNTTYYWRIDEKNAGGTTTGIVWRFTTVPALPGQATNPSPANLATNVSVNADLSWTAGAGATSRDVYFGTSSPGTFQGNRTGMTFDPGTMSYNTTYYWRIDEKNTGGTTTGVVWSFTTVPPPLGQATNPNPANLATNVSINADLSWTASAGATSRDVYFGTSSPGTFQGNWTGTTFDPGTMNTNTTYYWRIDEKNAGGTATGVVWRFTTVPPPPGQATNPSPANLATNVSVIADLNWTAGAGATSRDVYFGTSSPGTFQGNRTGTTFDPGTMSYNTIYYWRIDEKNAGGTTTGVVWMFTTAPAPPAQATNPSPANLATNINVNADLSWTAGAGATSRDVYFGTSSPGTFRGNQTGTTFDPGTMSINTTYYWRIDEKNAGGTITGVVWRFTTVPAPPAQATNPSPANLATNINVNADLSWTAGAGATSRDVYFGTSSPGTFRGNQTGTTFDLGTMNTNMTYYWRIDEKNAGGTTTGVVWSFTTVLPPPASATNPSPANMATGVGIYADLNWTTGAGTTSHDVYFGTSSPGTFQGNLTGTTFDPGTMSINTTYYWRIDEWNAGGTTTGPVWSFTTQTTPPMLPWSDGFESGNFTAGGWTKQNTAATVATGAAYSGTYGAKLTKTTWIEKAVSTAGFTDIHVQYVRKTSNYDAGEYLYVEWSINGTDWVQLEAAQQTTWALKDLTCGPNANNNPNFRIRFRANANAGNESADVDDVHVIGGSIYVGAGN